MNINIENVTVKLVDDKEHKDDNKDNGEKNIEGSIDIENNSGYELGDFSGMEGQIS